MSPDNRVRKSAEEAFNKGIESNCPGAATGLMQIISGSGNESIRGLAIVLFRKKIVKNLARISGMPPEFHTQVRKQLHTRLQNEPHAKNMRHLADLAVEVARLQIWPELIPFCVQMFKNEAKQKAILYLLGELVSELHEQMNQQNIAQMIQLAGQAFQSSNIDIKIEALSMFGKALVYISDVHKYESVVPQILATLTGLLQQQNFEKAQKVLQVLVDVAADKAKFFRAHIDAITELMKQIGSTEEMDGDVRQLALEVLVSIIEKEPSMVRKNKVFIEVVIDVSLRLMMMMDDDKDEWNSLYDANVDDNECFDAGQVALNRLAENINKKRFVPILMPKLQQLISSSDWKCKHTAIIAIAQTCELMLEGKISKNELFKQVAPLMADAHHRVRYAVVHCVGIMCTDFGRKFVNKWNNQILEIFMSAMADSANPRLMAHSAICVVNWAERVSTKLLKPNLEKLLKQLFAMINEPNIPRFCKENALGAVSEVADTAQDQFKKYYTPFVKALMNILQQATDADYLDLRLEAFRALTYIGVAVGASTFGNEAMTAMQISLPIVRMDGVEVARILNSWRRIFQTMQGDVMQFLPAVSEVTLKYVKQEVKLTDWNTSDEEAEDLEINERDIKVNASRVEEKVSALNLVYAMAKYSDGHFTPFIEKFTNAIFPLIEKPMDDSIQEAAAEAVPGFLICCVDSFKRSQHPPIGIIKQLMLASLSKISIQMPKEKSPDCLCSFALSIEKIVQVDFDLTRQCLTDECRKAVTETLLNCLKESAERMSTRTKAMRGDVDEEEVDKLKAENEQEAQLSTHISDAIGSFVEAYKERYLPLLGQYESVLAYMLGKDGLDIQKRAALYIFCDVIEHCPAESFKNMMDFLRNNFISAGQNQDTHVRQAGIYAIGQLVAKAGPNVGAPLTDIIKLCFDQFTDSKYNVGDVEDVQDNATMSIGRICKKAPNELPLPQIYPQWLNCFPIRSDDDCSKWCYAELLRLVETNNPHLLGANACNFPKIATWIGEVLFTNMSNDNIDNRFMALLKKIQNTQMGSDVFASLPEDIKEKLKEAG